MFLADEAVQAPEMPMALAQQLRRWAALTDALSRDETLPIRQEPRRAMYFAAYPAEHSRKSRAHVVTNNRVSGPKYGFRLAEGSNLELVIAHRIPQLIGSADSIQPTSVAIQPSNGNFAVSSDVRTLTGNYDRFSLNIAAAGHDNLPTDISLMPPQQIFSWSSGNVTSATAQLAAGVRVGAFYRLRTRLIPILLLWAAFFVLSYIAGTSQLKNHSGRLIIAAAVSGLASVVIQVSRK
jgi:hypothetical protein